jgi:transcriptional regulator of nitric oxide reductase
MGAMFQGAENYNHPIGNWDVSNVKNMRNMFYRAAYFNQDLTKWCVTNFSSKPTNFNYESGLSLENCPIWGTCPE